MKPTLQQLAEHAKTSTESQARAARRERMERAAASMTEHERECFRAIYSLFEPRP